jgi:TolB protein
MSYDLKTKKSKVICSYDGLNMQPSFSKDGIKAVLCLSARGNSELYMYDQTLCNKYNKRFFRQLTKNRGNNVSPCLLPNGNIIFCSDFETGNPQIYYFDTNNKITYLLTNGHGYCAAPAYCEKNNTIVYTRYHKGNFQLFTMDLSSPKHIERQITSGAGDKLDPSWSSCGQYVAFAYGYYDNHLKKRVQQIAALNLRSGKIRVLTSGKEYKSFPAWKAEPLFQG